MWHFSTASFLPNGREVASGSAEFSQQLLLSWHQKLSQNVKQQMLQHNKGREHLA
jgi:hypothetical protein